MTLNYLTVKDFCKTNPTFSENSLRWIIFNADTNGFAKCIKRIGRKILIDPVTCPT